MKKSHRKQFKREFAYALLNFPEKLDTLSFEHMIESLFIPIYFPRKSLDKIINVSKKASHLTMVRFFNSLEETIQQTIKDRKRYEKILLAAFAVSLATSRADQELSEKEKEILNIYSKYASASDLSPAIKRQFTLLKKSPPDAQRAFSYIKKLPNFIPVVLFETLIEAIATSDGLFCTKEKALLDQFRLEMGRLLSIPVVATMSSGKSTFINAMLGSPLLPAQNQACTATIMKIENLDGKNNFWGRQTTSQKGVSDWDIISPKTLEQWNAESGLEVEILGDFCNIANEDAHICLHDTPGPNNSMDKSHAAITIDLLERGSFGCVLCVLNAEQFGIDDERELLDAIISNRPVASDKKSIKDVHIIFVLNKFDSLDPESESGIKFIRKVITHITEVTGLSSPIVIPAMSRLCLSLRSLIHEYEQTETISLSKREQRTLLRQIRSMESNWGYYTEIFQSLYDVNSLDEDGSHAADSSDDFFRFAKESLIHSLEKMELGTFFGKIKLGEEDIDIQQIKKMEVLTGIPLIEKAINNYILLRNNSNKH